MSVVSAVASNQSSAVRAHVSSSAGEQYFGWPGSMNNNNNIISIIVVVEVLIR